MIQHNDNAYAAMLLTMALSPNREEYARPYGAQEFRGIVNAARAAGISNLGKLFSLDISGLMDLLGVDEAEGYRLYMLLNRTAPLSFAIDQYNRKEIDIVTLYDDAYPDRLKRALGDAAPPTFYRAGNASLFEQPAIALMGISGVKTSPEVREMIDAIAECAAQMGYCLITGGELGVSRVALNAAEKRGVPVLEIVGGGMEADLKPPEQRGENAVMSLVHPEAMFTVTHAIERNRAAFALSDVAFIFNTDGRRGEREALASRTCPWIYAWSGFPGNAPLIAHGATPFASLQDIDIESAKKRWMSARASQINLFDLI